MFKLNNNNLKIINEHIEYFNNIKTKFDKQNGNFHNGNTKLNKNNADVMISLTCDEN